MFSAAHLLQALVGDGERRHADVSLAAGLDERHDGVELGGRQILALETHLFRQQGHEVHREAFGLVAVEILERREVERRRHRQLAVVDQRVARIVPAGAAGSGSLISGRAAKQRERRGQRACGDERAPFLDIHVPPLSTASAFLEHYKYDAVALLYGPGRSLSKV